MLARSTCLSLNNIRPTQRDGRSAMDPTIKSKLNSFLSENEHLTVDQFEEQLRLTLGAEAVLVVRLNESWAKRRYSPGELLNLESTLRAEVTAKQPRFGSSDETMKHIQENSSGEKPLQGTLLGLYDVQLLHEWILYYKAIYDQVIKPN